MSPDSWHIRWLPGRGRAHLGQVVRKAGQFVAGRPGVDEQHTRPALHDNGIVLEQLAAVDQHTLRDLRQHGGPTLPG
ncbi:hypothetical protein ABZ234_01755 [Nocardiopsis sp. NPDC006198]|uniref:hypothetical protein n=1 Tax=Nocardiopsis sp. NPDC006198 TaxID=3154472 RepID=UPI0033A563BA